VLDDEEGELVEEDTVVVELLEGGADVVDTIEVEVVLVVVQELVAVAR
jgi:hypothetical protein